jgi:hypothetical protein
MRDTRVIVPGCVCGRLTENQHFQTSVQQGLSLLSLAYRRGQLLFVANEHKIPTDLIRQKPIAGYESLIKAVALFLTK